MRNGRIHAAQPAALLRERTHCVRLRRGHGATVAGAPLPSITLNTYSHLWPTAEDKTRAAATGMVTAALEGAADSLQEEC